MSHLRAQVGGYCYSLVVDSDSDFDSELDTDLETDSDIAAVAVAAVVDMVEIAVVDKAHPFVEHVEILNDSKLNWELYLEAEWIWIGSYQMDLVRIADYCDVSMARTDSFVAEVAAEALDSY